MSKKIIVTTRATVQGFSPEDDHFVLHLQFKEGSITIPVSKGAMEEIKPFFGQVLLFDISIPPEMPISEPVVEGEILPPTKV